MPANQLGFLANPTAVQGAMICPGADEETEIGYMEACST